MKKTNQPRIRELLRASPDGLTAPQLAAELRIDRASAHKSLRSMPDAYIDRWTKVGNALAAVWVAVQIPEHCPRPGK